MHDINRLISESANNGFKCKYRSDMKNLCRYVLPIGICKLACAQGELVIRSRQQFGKVLTEG